MVRPLLAAAALGAALLIQPPAAQAQQEQGVCTSDIVGCSAGPQNCATLEFEGSIGGVTVHITKYCYQPV